MMGYKNFFMAKELSGKQLHATKGKEEKGQSQGKNGGRRTNDEVTFEGLR
jgi:hypothetical protein